MEDINQKVFELSTACNNIYAASKHKFEEECPMIDFGDGSRGYMTDSPCNSRVGEVEHSETILDIIDTHLTTIAALAKSL